MAPIYRLHLFGGPKLLREGASIDRLSAHHLAMLCLIACLNERGRSISREQLFPFLWPESTARRARNSLNQLLFTLRRLLPEDIVTDGARLALDPKQTSCDLWEFNECLAANDLDRAIGLRCAPLLAQFSLTRIPELDEWVEWQRRAADRRFHALLELRASEAEKHRDATGAAKWWSMLLDEVPTSVHAVLGAMRAFREAGMHSSALECALEFQTRLRGEGHTPKPEVEALVREIREDVVRQIPAVDLPPRVPEHATASSDQPRIRRRAIWLVSAASLVALIILAWQLRPAGANRIGQTGDSDPTYRVLLYQALESSKPTDTLSGLFAEVAAELADFPAVGVESSVTRAEGPVEVGTLATVAGKKVGASLVFHGTASGSGQMRRVLIRAIRVANSQEVDRFVVDWPKAGLPSTARDIAARLLLAWAAEYWLLPLGPASIRSNSLPALKKYLAAEQALREDRFAAAVSLLEAALDADSTMTPAWARLTFAARRAGLDAVMKRAEVRTREQIDRLPPESAIGSRALLHLAKSDYDAAIGLLRTMADEDPLNHDLWRTLGTTIVYSSPLYGRDIELAADPLRRALALDKAGAVAQVALARVDGERGLVADSDGALDVAGNDAVPIEAIRMLLRWHHGTRRDVMIGARIDNLTGDEASYRRAVEFLDDPMAVQGLATQLVRSGSPAEVRMGERLMIRALLASGRYQDATSWLQRVAPEDPSLALEMEAPLAASQEYPIPPARVHALRLALTAWNPHSRESPDGHVLLHPVIRLHLAALLALRAGDDPAVAAWRDSLRAVRGPLLVEQAARTALASLEAHRLARTSPAQALALLEAANWPEIADFMRHEVLDRYLRGSLLARLGRHGEAVGWFRSIAQRTTYEQAFRGLSLLHLERSYAALANREASERSYRELAKLWKDADTSFRVMVDSAKAELVKEKQGLLE